MNKEFLGKANGCKTVEEIKELAEKENVELTDEELSEVAGGCESRPPQPPRVGEKPIMPPIGVTPTKK